MFLKKKYGQNLLADTSFIYRMTKESDLDSSCCIFEIGPGTGCLTKELLSVVKEVTAIEIDTDFRPELNKLESLYPGKLNIIYGDILKCDLPSILDKTKNWNVFANIPYYITSPIIELLLENRHLFNNIYLTVQKEVAERICAVAGSKDRGSFSCYTQYYAECHLHFTIPAGAFMPPPKVDSAFMSMKIHKNPLIEEPYKKIRPLIARAFEMRRKTLRNSLSNFSQNILELLEIAGVNPGARPQELGLNDFAEIAKALENAKDSLIHE